MVLLILLIASLKSHISRSYFLTRMSLCCLFELIVLQWVHTKQSFRMFLHVCWHDIKVRTFSLLAKFDTGLSTIYLPERYHDVVQKQLNTKFDSTLEVNIAPCASVKTFPDWTFTFSNQAFTIPASEYVLDVSLFSLLIKKCKLTIITNFLLWMFRLDYRMDFVLLHLTLTITRKLTLHSEIPYFGNTAPFMMLTMAKLDSLKLYIIRIERAQPRIPFKIGL